MKYKKLEKFNKNKKKSHLIKYTYIQNYKKVPELQAETGNKKIS